MSRTKLRPVGLLFLTWLIAASLQHTEVYGAEGNVFDQIPQVRLVAAQEGDQPGTAQTTPAAESAESAESAEGCEVTSDECMRRRQSFDTISFLQDGQPGRPGQIELNFFSAWQTQSRRSDLASIAPEIKWTPSFLPNTEFGLGLPIGLFNGRIDGNADIYLSWLQRWVQESEGEWWPTFSTLNELRIPNGYGSEGLDWTLTGILAKELGPGTAYMNAFLRSANGQNDWERGLSWADALYSSRDYSDDRRHFQWGFRWGYKWRITDCFALIGDYVLQSNPLRGWHNQHIGEVSAEWRLSNQLTIGPGIMYTLDGSAQTPNFGAGVKLHYAFN